MIFRNAVALFPAIPERAFTTGTNTFGRNAMVLTNTPSVSHKVILKLIFHVLHHPSAAKEDSAVTNSTVLCNLQSTVLQQRDAEATQQPETNCSKTG